MENNIVTFKSIRRKAISELGLSAKLTSMAIFVLAVCLLFTVDMPDLQKHYLFGIAFLLILLVNLGAWLLGKYSKHFQMKAALRWYKWDMDRITLFNELKEEWRNKFEDELTTLVEELLLKEPDSRNKLKEEAIQMTKDFLEKIRNQKEVIEARLNDDEIELIRILQLKSAIDEQEERMTEWLLDFLSDLNREAENVDLSRQRLLSILRQQNIPALEDKLRYYDVLLASCKKSTHDLKVILNDHYDFRVE